MEDLPSSLIYSYVYILQPLLCFHCFKTNAQAKLKICCVYVCICVYMHVHVC